MLAKNILDAYKVLEELIWFVSSNVPPKTKAKLANIYIGEKRKVLAKAGVTIPLLFDDQDSINKALFSLRVSQSELEMVIVSSNLWDEKNQIRLPNFHV